MMPGSEGAGFFCKNGVKNTPEKHWFFGILLAGAKINGESPGQILS